jgi:hypothetical protein
MNNRQKKQLVTAVIAVIVIYFLYKMFTKKSSFNPARYRSGAAYSANQALEQKKNEIRTAMRQRNQGGEQGTAGAARFAEIQQLVKNGDRAWKQAMTEVFEMKG